MNESKRRIFFLADIEYPRGGATANYIQYLAMASMAAGYEPIVIAQINHEFKSELSTGKYFGIRTIELKLGKNRLIRHIQLKKGRAHQKKKILLQEKIGIQDIVYLSGANKETYKMCLSMQCKHNFKLICGILELFEFKDFEGRFRWFNYEKYWYTCSVLAPKCDMVLPISTYIQDFYSQKGVQTFIVPPLTENRATCTKTEDCYKFVLPANGKMKDNLASMVRAFLLLSQEERENIELHLCGVKEENVRAVISDSEWECLSSIVTIHKWMKYDELERLYQQMHYLLLARDVCQMNIANFPSKIPETMAYGIVPIASRVGDYTSLYLKDKDNSFILDGSDAEQVAQAIRVAISLPMYKYRQMSEAAKHCVANSFDYRTFSEKLKVALDSLFVSGGK